MIPLPPSISLSALRAQARVETEAESSTLHNRAHASSSSSASSSRKDRVRERERDWEVPKNLGELSGFEIEREVGYAMAWIHVADHISPKNIDISTTKPASKELEADLQLLLRGSDKVVPILVQNFLDDMAKAFTWIEADIRRTMLQLEAANLNVDPVNRTLEVLNALFDKIWRWLSGWSSGMKWLDLHYKPLQPTTKSYAFNSFYPAFLSSLHLSLPSPTFHTSLRTYFRSTLPGLYPPSYYRSLSPQAAEEKSTDPRITLPNRFLYRIGVLPRYASMLADIAYEQVGRIVRGEWDATPEVRVAAVERALMEGFVKDGAGVTTLDGPTGSVVGSRRGSEKENRPPEMAGDGEGGGGEGEESLWARGMLDDLREGVRRDVMRWLDAYLEAAAPGDYQRRVNIETRLEYKLQTELFALRCEQMFDIIIDFPESMNGLRDMADCDALSKALRRQRLTPILNESIRSRLLHPGAETRDIIRLYVLTIKALRVIDQSGVLLHSVAGPIRTYLKSRADTVANIVSMLVETDELSEENEKVVREIQLRNEVAEEWNDINWEPEPIDAAPEFRSRKATDILSTLVSMYDSRDVVVTELQAWLARRLLEIKNYRYEEDFAKVETLKQRFGDATLQVCEIMIKDMKDSKRVNGQVQKAVKQPVVPIILSQLYWPTIPHNQIKLPRRLKKMQEKYDRQFQRLKEDKHLRFVNHLGSVAMKVELSDRIVEVDATPLQATVLHAFSKKDRYDLHDLADKVGSTDLKVVKHAVNFWINEGVIALREDSGEYVLLETATEEPAVKLETDEGPVIESASDARADMEKHSWSAVQKLLSSGASFSTAILHRLLGRDPAYRDTPETLERFLGEAARSGLVESTGTGWKLPPA